MRTQKLLLTLFLIAAPFAAASARQAAQEPPKQKPPAGGAPKPFNLPKKEEFTLKNGMRVTLVPYGSIPKVTVSAVVRSGNLNESANQVWLADLTGDMLKEGTATRTAEQIAQQAASMGGQIGVGVGPDTTNVNGDALSEFGPQLVALMADVIRNPKLPASELQRHQNDMLRQLSVSRSQPGPVANELFRKILYPEHPYGRIFPTEEMVKSYTIEDVRKFYQENFGAARTRLYVAGQFDASAMRKAITDAFDGWEAGRPPVINVPKPAAVHEIHLVDRPNTPQATIYVGLPVVDPSSPDYIPFVVTNALLGGSFGSRITSNIREQKGYTYSPFSQISARYRDAYWVEVADVTTAVTGPALKEIFNEVERLRSEPPSEEELQGIKNYLAGIFVLQNSSRQGVINQLAFADLHGLPGDYLSTYVQKVTAVTPKDVQRIAQQYLASDKMAVVVVGDKSKVAEQLSQFGKVIAN
ncbi:MAG TPA: pitrilysin family protein [Pyrinomonadaceae bacterium]|nr:pitrilysin family protein [Pyrinomonadaceae bacterium]